MAVIRTPPPFLRSRGSPIERPLTRAHRIPGWLLRQMLLNNAVSAAVGFVPFIGDLVLAAYKANSRNAALLEEFLRIRGDEFLKAERKRAENPEIVKPGAGAEPGDVVDGKKKEKKKEKKKKED